MSGVSEKQRKTAGDILVRIDYLIQVFCTLSRDDNKILLARARTCLRSWLQHTC